DGKAATRFFRKILKHQGRRPRVLVTDKLASYRVAHRTTRPTTEHRHNKYLNNRCENSHQPTRQRERAMKGFRTVGSAQRFLAAFSRISPHFRPPRHRMTATDHRAERTARFRVWDPVTEQALAA
ncbi:DDE-type integrase/transposase/recombinase, partial [Rhodococcus erythropolis]|uniref:DDE-type integrase/transposase/recombinase n=1 Tax=Rhodococcus erythropolis TaxID=1833 RepID=UPI0029498553